MGIPKILFLKTQARDELYKLIDTHYKPMPKKEDGSIDPYAHGLADNDIDALRHAYVSGVYTMEYGETTAEMLGRLNELTSNSRAVEENSTENMDLWNNAAGRSYGKIAKSRKELFDFLLKAMKEGELITEPSDSRKYKGEKIIKRVPKNFVIKIKENESGANILFYDFTDQIVMTKEQFLSNIKSGMYNNYSYKTVDGIEIPISKRDRFKFNNLG
jgi:hypothetical protein